MESAPYVSLVMPAFEEAVCIAGCVREAREVLARWGKPFEIIVVDDGSGDGTYEAVVGLKGTMPELRAFRLRRNCGQTAAMAAGFSRARGEIVVTMDADGQNDPGDIPGLVALTGAWDVVCGWRRKREDSVIRRLSSRIANGVRNRLTGEEIRDTGCTLKAFRREYLLRVKLFEGMHRFLPTLLRFEGARVTEVAVNHRRRAGGRTKYGVWNRLFRGLRDLWAVRWMRSRWLRYEIVEGTE